MDIDAHPQGMPPRCWLVQEPTHWRALGIFGTLRAEDACAAAARAEGMACEAFHASWLPGSRALHDRGEGLELYAVDLSAGGTLEVLRALDESALLELADAADGGYYTARMP